MVKHFLWKVPKVSIKFEYLYNENYLDKYHIVESGMYVQALDGSS